MKLATVTSWKLDTDRGTDVRIGTRTYYNVTPSSLRRFNLVMKAKRLNGETIEATSVGTVVVFIHYWERYRDER